ncbi:MAG: transglutaminase family protein [Exilibacterium sp.]
MKRYNILHQTTYTFPEVVQLQAHTLRLRPREGHELRIESSSLNLEPNAIVRWHRDAEGNSVATANFASGSDRLSIESNITIQQYDQAPYDFLVSDYAELYPFDYQEEDKIILTPYLRGPGNASDNLLSKWVGDIWRPGEKIQTYSLLKRLNERTHQALSYQLREEPGVQTPDQSLSSGAGSCRDSANLFMAAAQLLGLASRFVSGYIYSPPPTAPRGSTHAWAEVFLPGAGWKGFDPTTGHIVGADHIAVAVARLPESVPPVSGTYIGAPGANMSVGVWVTDLG